MARKYEDCDIVQDIRLLRRMSLRTISDIRKKLKEIESLDSSIMRLVSRYRKNVVITSVHDYISEFCFDENQSDYLRQLEARRLQLSAYICSVEKFVTRLQGRVNTVFLDREECIMSAKGLADYDTLGYVVGFDNSHFERDSLRRVVQSLIDTVCRGSFVSDMNRVRKSFRDCPLLRYLFYRHSFEKRIKVTSIKDPVMLSSMYMLVVRAFGLQFKISVSPNIGIYLKRDYEYYADILRILFLTFVINKYGVMFHAGVRTVDPFYLSGFSGAYPAIEIISSPIQYSDIIFLSSPYIPYHLFLDFINHKVRSGCPEPLIVNNLIRARSCLYCCYQHQCLTSYDLSRIPVILARLVMREDRPCLRISAVFYLTMSYIVVDRYAIVWMYSAVGRVHSYSHNY